MKQGFHFLVQGLLNSSELLEHLQPGRWCAPLQNENHKIYKFNSQAEGDVIMLEASGDQLLTIIGRKPSAQGIITHEATEDQEPGHLGTEVAVSGDSVRLRATEPLFTYKERCHGTGLGLPMVAGFVSQSRGNVKIQSVEGQDPALAELVRAWAKAQGHTVVLANSADVPWPLLVKPFGKENFYQAIASADSESSFVALESLN